MKKSIVIPIVIITSMAVLVVIAYVSFVLIFGTTLGKSNEILLTTSGSPDGNYTVEAYRTEPGATVDFSVKAYIVNGKSKKIIYNAYHEREVEIIWISNNEISINGRVLDLSKRETYDWKKDY